MEFEDILKDIGGFGLYQKTLILIFMIPTFTILPFFEMGLIFMSNTPEHWCYVPEVAESNLSLVLQKEIIRPNNDSSCSMYDIDYSQILYSENLTVDATWPTKKCSNGWQYDTTNYDATAVTGWNMVCKDAHYNSLLLSMIFIGAIFGTPLFGFMSDKIGRRPAFFSLVIVIGISEICSVFSPFFIVFLVLRALLSSATNTVYSSGYIILLELVSPEYRSWVNGLATTSWTLGLCLLPLFAWLTRSWVKLSILITSFAAGLTLYWKLLPESPRWLISENRYDEAHAILAKISKMNGKTLHKDDQLMKKIEIFGEKIKQEKASEEKHSPLDFFRYPTLRKRFLLVTLCWIGVTNVYYGLQMNVRYLTGNEFLNFFLISLVEFPAHLVTWLGLERIGRRWTMVFGLILTAIGCAIPVFSPQGVFMVDVMGSLLAKLGMSSAFMTLYQQAPEIFPTSLRCQGMSISSSIAAGSTSFMPYIVDLAKYGASIPFIMFSIMAILAAISSSFLPETLNKNLPQTVIEAENFEKNFKFFPWSKEKEKESVCTNEDNLKSFTVIRY